jgi:hypothetical protein
MRGTDQREPGRVPGPVERTEEQLVGPSLNLARPQRLRQDAAGGRREIGHRRGDIFTLEDRHDEEIGVDVRRVGGANAHRSGHCCRPHIGDYKLRPVRITSASKPIPREANP